MLKIPPYNQEAEQAVLGMMLVNDGIIPQIRSLLSPDDFYRDEHRILAGTFFTLPRGQADLPSIISHLRAAGTLEKTGGQDYFISLMEATHTTAAWKHWCNLIKDCSNRRKVIESCQLACEASFGLHNDLPETISVLRDSIQIDTDTGPDYSDNKSFYRDRWDDLYSEQIVEPGLYTGLPIEDKLYFEKGYIHCIAAESGIGKSAIALQIADSIQAEYGPVAFYSLESTRTMLSNRLIARKARIALSRIYHRNLDDSQDLDIQSALSDLQASKLYLIDDSKFTRIEALISHAEAYTEKHDLKFIIIDFLQMLYAGQRTNSRHLEISYIVSQIKALAKNLNIPVLYTSQLRKDIKGRPTLDDLKESGDIRTMTDNIVFLYAPNGNEEAEYPVEFFLAKGKEQRLFSKWLKFNGHFQMFSEGVKPEKKSKSVKI